MEEIWLRNIVAQMEAASPPPDDDALKLLHMMASYVLGVADRGFHPSYKGGVRLVLLPVATASGTNSKH